MAAGARLPGLIGAQTGPTRYNAIGARTLAYRLTTSIGSLTRNQPIAIRSLSGTATRLRSFFDDWYNRVHVTPTLIDFGFVASQVNRPVSVWNAYLGPTTLSTVTIVNNSGLSLSGPSLPETMQQFEALQYDVIAAADGDPQIDTRLTFTFSDRPDLPRLVVNGQRARMFDYRPNWRESVTVGLEYRTDIITSRSGKEQRRALRNEPRKTVEYTIGIHRDKLRAFERLMARWQTKAVTMGDPTRGTTTTATLMALENSVAVASVPRWLTAGTPVMLESGDRREILLVSDVAFGVVTFTSGALLNWPVGAMLRPTISGLLGTSISETNLTDELAEVRISLAVDPGSEPVYITDGGFMIHGGREVFPFAENWLEPVETQFSWNRDTVDFGYGRISSYTPTDFGTRIHRASFLNVSAEQAQEMSDFFDRMKGQQGEFYWPSSTNDLPPAAPLVEGGDTMRVAGRETFDAFNDDTVYRAVAVRLFDDRMIYRTVIDMYLDAGDTIIQFSEPWISDVPVSEIVRVSWMTAARFASDQFTAEWTTSEVMQSQLAIQTLEDLPVENPLVGYDGAAQWLLEKWGALGFTLFERFDWMVNVLYPAIFFVPEAWVARGEADVDRFDVLINVRYPAAVD